MSDEEFDEIQDELRDLKESEPDPKTLVRERLIKNSEMAIRQVDTTNSPILGNGRVPEFVDSDIRGITARQVAFCREYMVDFSAGKAALRAGYKQPGIAYALLKREPIKMYIKKLMTVHLYSMGVTKERVLVELARIAFGDIRDLLEYNNHTVVLKDSREIDGGAAAMIKSINMTKDGVKITLHDKMNALDKLADHLGLDAPKETKSEHEHKHDHRVTFQPVMGHELHTQSSLNGKSDEGVDSLEATYTEVEFDGGK